MTRIKAMLANRIVSAQLTGNDNEGRPYTGAGYQAATIRQSGQTIQGKLAWLAGAWRFIPNP